MATVEQAPIRITTIDDLAGMAAIASHWRALESHPGNTFSFFQTYGWCHAWVETFANRGSSIRPRIICAWHGDRLAALWPLAVEGGLFRPRTLRALGGAHTQYCNLLVDPDLMDAEIAVALKQVVEHPADCDVAVFQPVPAQSAAENVLSGYPSLPGHTDASSILDLSVYASSDDYTARLGKLQKRNRNRRRNHLARLGELDFEVIWPDHPDFRPLVASCLQMKRDWLRATRRLGLGLRGRKVEQFLSLLEGDGARGEGVCLSVLRVGGRPVAIELGARHGGHYYAFMGGYDMELARLSPGKVQMEMTVAWLIDRGVRVYDLLGSPDAYKQSWSNRSEPLRAYARHFSLRGLIYSLAWLPGVRNLAKRVYGTVPTIAERALGLAKSSVPCLLYCV